MTSKSITAQWSPEDQEFVATHPSYPSLSWLASTEQEAVEGLRRLIKDIEADRGVH